MLSAVPGLAADTLLVIFAMIDRFDPDSAWAPFWAALPAAFCTGLSFPPRLLAALAGTAAALELARGQAHLRAQFEATRPLLDALLEAYPQHLSPEWFAYERYVWAAELFYSYAFEIEFPPAAKSKTVMVPFACLVNHSPWPHVVRYGRLDPRTRTLDYPAFRPCPKGAQAFISYGPVPNLKLLAYYGFALDGNPHDLVPVQLEASAVRI
jgi:histone-lysine N-methyltransferase SETD3